MSVQNSPETCKAAPSRIEARASHRFEIPAERVYDDWLDPKKVRAWMALSLQSFGLAGDIRRMEIDPRVGGRFCFSDMRNGSEAVHWGEYLVLDRPRKIVFTWVVGEADPATDSTELPSRVSVAIEPDGAGCMATIVHEMDSKWAEFVSKTAQGWTRMLQAIARLESQAPVARPTTLAPLLSVRRGAAAIEFYARALDAKILSRIDDDSGDVVARLCVNGAEFWLADESPAHLNFSPETLGGGTVRMVLTVDNPDEVFSRAIEAGATVISCVADQPYGWRVGRFADPFGHHWEVGRPLADCE